MGEIPLLGDLLIAISLGVLSAIALNFLRLPAVTGLIVAGALAGPYGLGVVKDVHSIELLAEIGVVFLLFTIGLEFSLGRLKRIAKIAFTGGTIQVGLTTILAVFVATHFGYDIRKGIFFGFLIALSSTAIVLKSLSERGEIDAPHGKVIVATLIFQDLCVVPMMLIIPVLASESDFLPILDLLTALTKAGVMVAGALIVGRWVVPRVLAKVDVLHSKEIFLLAVIAICIGTAVLTSMTGLSLALGAFLAGVVLSESEYAHQALVNVLPLRHVLTSLFFMFIGMLFDVRVMESDPSAIVLIFIAIVLGKGAVAMLSALAMRFPVKIAFIAGAGLAQFSEFGFVLSRLGAKVGLLGASEERIILGAGVLTMFLTPLMLKLSPHFAAGVSFLKPLDRLLGAKSVEEVTKENPQLKDHIIIVGFGVVGRLLARNLKQIGAPYIIVDLNSETVREARSAGEPAYYGDITSEEVQELAGIHRARAMVIVINDPESARLAVTVASRIAPQTDVILRCRYLANYQEAIESGATDVVTEELEAGLEILARVLRLTGMPANIMHDFVEEARQLTLPSARKVSFTRRTFCEISELDELKVESFLVKESSFVRNKSLSELKLRTATNATVVAVRHDGKLLEHPDATIKFSEGDILYLVGSKKSVGKALTLMETGLLQLD